MDDERRRILRMLAEGTISVDECNELLRALSTRRTHKVEREVQAARAKRRVWPYVLLIGLAVVAIPLWGGRILSGRHFSSLLFPGFFAPLSILLFAFWIWMVVDCLTRIPFDFRLLFTDGHEYEKWIWIGIVLLAGWLGALAYFVVIRQPARSIVPPKNRDVPEGAAPEKPEIQKSEEPIAPRPRARSTMSFFLVVLLIAGMGVGALVVFLPSASVFGISAVGLFSVAVCVLAIWMGVFYIWMFIDCLARDYREFGTLITSDRSLDKLLWLLLVVVFPIIGGLAYHYSVRRRQCPATGTA